QFAQQRLGKGRAAKPGEFLDLRGAQDGNDARNQRNGHSQLRQAIAELEVIAVLEEQLGDHEVRALVDLVLQATPVHVFAFLAGDVPFRKPGDTDGKTAQVAQELHQLIGVLETAVGLLKLARAAWRIAAQGENVADAQLPRFRQIAANLFFGSVDASQVRHGGQALLALNAVDNHQGLVSRAAAGAVGDGAEVRVELLQGGNRLLQQCSFSLVGPGWEEFK